MKNLLDLTGKKALVTGGSRGIGHRLAQALHDAGAEVVFFYNSTCPDGLAEQMQGNGPVFMRSGAMLRIVKPWSMV